MDGALTDDLYFTSSATWTYSRNSIAVGEVPILNVFSSETSWHGHKINFKQHENNQKLCDGKEHLSLSQ